MSQVNPGGGLDTGGGDEDRSLMSGMESCDLKVHVEITGAEYRGGAGVEAGCASIQRGGTKVWRHAVDWLQEGVSMCDGVDLPISARDSEG